MGNVLVWPSIQTDGTQPPPESPQTRPYKSMNCGLMLTPVMSASPVRRFQRSPAPSRAQSPLTDTIALAAPVVDEGSGSPRPAGWPTDGGTGGAQLSRGPR